MPTSKRNSLLCPNCNRLISADEPVCIHCGLANPGARWKNVVWLKKLLREESFFPVLLYSNALMYLLSLGLDPSALFANADIWSLFAPSSESLVLLGASGTLPIDRMRHWWSLLAANYLHGSLLHIVFNMLALRDLVPLVGKEFGTYRMASIYTLGGIACYAVSYLAGIGLTIGASGAICALIGAALYYGKSRGGTYGSDVFRQTIHWVAMIFLFGFFVPGINNWGHAGGLLGGFLCAWMLGYQEKHRELSWHKSLALVCVVLTLATLAWGIANAALSFIVEEII